MSGERGVRDVKAEEMARGRRQPKSAATLARHRMIRKVADMESLPRDYTPEEVLDLIVADCDVGASWQAVVKNAAPELVQTLKETLASIANAPRFFAELRERPWQKQVTQKRLSRLAATLERLAPRVEEAIVHPMVRGRFLLPMVRHPELAAEDLRAAQQWLAEIPKGMRWLAKAIRMSMEEGKRNKFRIKDKVASDTRLFLLGLEESGLKFDRNQDFEDAANILRPVYDAAGLKGHAPRRGLARDQAPNVLLPADPLPTAESLKALRRRARLPF